MPAWKYIRIDSYQRKRCYFLIRLQIKWMIEEKVEGKKKGKMVQVVRYTLVYFFVSFIS
jgi:hypothetical protein